MQQAMILELVGAFDTDAVCDRVQQRVEAIGAEFDGTERSDRELRIFCYGPSADAMLAAIEADIDGWRCAKGSMATLRHGDVDDDDAPEFVVSLEVGAARTRRRRRHARPAKRYRLGDWFAQPILGQGYVVGRVVAAGGPMIIAYYWGPFRPVVPELIEVEHLRPRRAFTYAISGDHALLDTGGAVVLGGHDTFDERKWPVPLFRSTARAQDHWGVRFDRKAHEILPRRRLVLGPFRKLESNSITLGSPDITLLARMIERKLLPASARVWADAVPPAQPGDFG